MFHVPTAMASIRSIHRWDVDNLFLTPTSSAIQTQPPKHVILPMPISRRCAILISVLPFSLISQPHSSDARERRTKKNIPLEDYLTSREFLIPFSLSLSIDYIYLGFHFLVIFYSGCGSVWCNFSSEAGVRKIRMYVPWCMILWVYGFWFFTLNQFCLALLSLIVSVYRRWQWLFDGPITQWEFVVLLLILD